MGLKEEVRERAARPPTRNKFPWVLEQLGDEADEFLEVLADESITTDAIYRTLRARDIDIERESVRRWCVKAR